MFIIIYLFIYYFFVSNYLCLLCIYHMLYIKHCKFLPLFHINSSCNHRFLKLISGLFLKCSSASNIFCINLFLIFLQCYFNESVCSNNWFKDPVDWISQILLDCVMKSCKKSVLEFQVPAIRSSSEHYLKYNVNLTLTQQAI